MPPDHFGAELEKWHLLRIAQLLSRHREEFLEVAPEIEYSHLHYWNKYGLFIRKTPLNLQQEILYLKRFLLRAHQSGVTTAIGTDTPFPRLAPGFSLHDEIASYVDSGIKPVDALRSATSVNAKVLKKESLIGKIAKGFDADFTIVDLNKVIEIKNENIQSKCGWSPFNGYKFKGTPISTIVNGEIKMKDGKILGEPKGQPIVFK